MPPKREEPLGIKDLTELYEEPAHKETAKEKKEREKKAAASKKRNRVPISCTICRRRKVKCDKRRPVCAACERTGVAHLCHYIDPPWAQPLSNEELNVTETAESEVERLKEKIQQLEAQLASGDHSEVDPVSPDNDDDSQTEENENDSLNLGKKFDMLHIKSTTTTHLGATSWLAIMKGDPYLRVLWAHIFKMRKQVEELKFRKNMMKHPDSRPPQSSAPPPATAPVPTQSVPTPGSLPAPSPRVSKCPVAHTEIFKAQKKESQPEPEQQCPVSGNVSGMGKCPVAHDMEENGDLELPAKRSREDTDETTDGTDSPVTGEEDDRVCPLMIGDNSFLDKFKQDQEVATPGVKEFTHKRKKTRSDSSESSKSTSRKVAPEDFKANPVVMMEKYLPTKRVLWLFLDRFFEVLYIYLPYVDEKAFKEDVEFIVGKRDDEDQGVKIRIRSGVDFALVGTVCIILRLVWNTLPINNSNRLLGKSIHTKTYTENQESLAILQKPENEIPIELIDCVKHCFSNLKLMRKSSLKIVQCGLYMRYYFMYSPEDGDGADGGDSQIFLGMIIQMAISIGLHRDPKNFENFTNERQRHLWRKIWFALLSLDVSQSVNLGCPRGLQGHEEFSDTIIPGSIKNGADLEEFKDDLRELTVIKNIHTQAKLDALISKTMKVLLNVNKPAKRYQVDALIKDLQHSISGFNAHKDQYCLPQLGKILVNRAKGEPLYSSGTKAIQFRAHATVNMLIYLLNYILYVHFEPRGAQDPQMANIAKNYAQRALNCALEGYRNCTLFFDCGLDYFGPGADLVLSPLLLLVGHRSMQFMVSLILRSRCGPFMRSNIVDTPVPEKTEPEQTQKRVESEEGFQEMDHPNHDLDNIEVKDQTPLNSTFDLDVNAGETLATILLEHMVKFHHLAERLGKKYPYSWRMAKAVFFFITLLRKPTNVVKSIVKTENVKNVENNTGEISNVLNSVPLVLSPDEEQLRKCPVFMKAEESATRSTVQPQQTQEQQKHQFQQFQQMEHQQQEQHQQQAQQQQAQFHQQFVQAQQHAAQFQPMQQQQQQQQQEMPMPMLFAPQTPAYDAARMFALGVPPPEMAQMGIPPQQAYPMFMANGTSDIDPSEQFPELVQPDAFVNLGDADKSLGDMFGVLLGSENGGGMGEMAYGDGGAASNVDINMMMNGNWFA